MIENGKVEEGSTKPAEVASAPTTFPPLPLRILCWVALPGTSALTLRILWEETLLTWQRGPQMVGYSLAHLHPELLIPMALSALASALVLLAILVAGLGRLIRRMSIRPVRYFEFATLFLCVGLLLVPYDVWTSLHVEVAGPGPHAAEFLTIAAAQGSHYLVQVLLSKGIAVDVLDESGHTALNAACVAKNVRMARYLMSRGANLSRAPECQWVEEIVPHPDRVKVPGTTVVVH